MKAREILENFMKLKVKKELDDSFSLVFENYETVLRVNEILDALGMSHHDKYCDLLKTSEENGGLLYFYLQCDTLWQGISEKEEDTKEKELVKFGGSRQGLVLDDLKQYRKNYQLWLNGYLDLISPKIQEKFDSIIDKDLTEEDVEKLLDEENNK